MAFVLLTHGDLHEELPRYKTQRAHSFGQKKAFGETWGAVVCIHQRGSARSDEDLAGLKLG